MTKWTFLLQKDGDRSWLPLGSTAVAVGEGRYRIVAQTEHPNADISIRICHLATTEDPPKRRIQKRSNRTNRNGLMVVTPFTRLQPGDWEFSCFLTDPMSDLIGDMVHQAVRLQVSPSAAPVAIAANPANPEVPNALESNGASPSDPVANRAVVVTGPSTTDTPVETPVGVAPDQAAISPQVPADGVPMTATSVEEEAFVEQATSVEESVELEPPVALPPHVLNDSVPVVTEPTPTVAEPEDVWTTPAAVVEPVEPVTEMDAAITSPAPNESPSLHESSRLEPVAAEANPDELPDLAPPVPEPFVVSHTSAHEMESLNVEIAQSLGVSMDRLVAMTDQLSHQLIEEIFREFNLPVVVEPATETPETVEDTIAPPELPRVDVRQVAIALAQDSWLAATGEVLAIAGELCQTDVLNEDGAIADGLDVSLEDAIPQELQVQFRDPQTSRVLFHARQSFPQGELPLAFTFQCPVPEELSTHLLLGEVLIVGALPGAETAAITLKSITFTVTVDPQGLVDELQKVKTALAAAAEPEDLPDAVMQFSSRLQREKQRPLLDLSFLNLAAPIPESAPPEPAPVATSAQAPAPTKPRSVLPPQLYQRSAEPSSTEQPSKRKLELPMFAGTGARSQAVAIAEPPTTVAVADSATSSIENAFFSSTAELQAMVVSDAIATPDTPMPPPSPRPTGFSPEDMPPTSSSTRTATTSPDPSDTNLTDTDTSGRDTSGADAINSDTDGTGSDTTNTRSTLEPESFAELEALLHQVNVDSEPPQTSAVPTESVGVPESVTSCDRDRRADDLARLDELTSPVRSAFQALNLQDKFLDRLSSLASDAELATLLKLTLPTDETQAKDSTAEPEASVATGQTVNPLPRATAIAEPETTEVVVDDDPTWRAWVKRAGMRGQVTEPAIDPATANLVLPADQPIPVPELDITPVEWVAGKTMNLRVRLPNLLPKIYVKLWIHDRQTRSLLDGPRWLVNLSPNGFDELEATTQLLVPMGSLQIRLEAIAVEMHTQRESQKVGLDFDVMPPDLPEDPFADFDL